jgi:hypothetical protein
MMRDSYNTDCQECGKSWHKSNYIHPICPAQKCDFHCCMDCWSGHVDMHRLAGDFILESYCEIALNDYVRPYLSGLAKGVSARRTHEGALHAEPTHPGRVRSTNEL